MVNNKIKVLIVDDSATIRKVLKEILSADTSIEIIAASSNPIIAMARMEQEWPDVIITDIEMPKMDGITFMKEIMAKKPTPFVICSTVLSLAILKCYLGHKEFCRKRRPPPLPRNISTARIQGCSKIGTKAPFLIELISSRIIVI